MAENSNVQVEYVHIVHEGPKLDPEDCTHPVIKQYSWFAKDSLVLDKQGDWIPDKDGNPKIADILCVCCCLCGAVLRGGA